MTFDGEPRMKHSGRVLVVEDDQGVLELVTQILCDTGYAVDSATSSQAALSKVRGSQYDVVILDLILPDTDGVILYGKLKKLRPGLQNKTIFMTGFTSRAPVINYLKSLGAGFLHKPFGPEELVRAVRSL